MSEGSLVSFIKAQVFQLLVFAYLEAPVSSFPSSWNDVLPTMERMIYRVSEWFLSLKLCHTYMLIVFRCSSCRAPQSRNSWLNSWNSGLCLSYSGVPAAGRHRAGTADWTAGTAVYAYHIQVFQLPGITEQEQLIEQLEQRFMLIIFRCSSCRAPQSRNSWLNSWNNGSIHITSFLWRSNWTWQENLVENKVCSKILLSKSYDSWTKLL